MYIERQRPRAIPIPTQTLATQVVLSASAESRDGRQRRGVPAPAASAQPADRAAPVTRAVEGVDSSSGAVSSR